ncbi:MAG: hypothetical protein ACLTXM_11605 [Enterococcus sp.]
MLLLPIIYKKWENYRKERKEQVYFVGSDVYSYGTFKHNLTWNGTMVYESKPDYFKEEYIYAVENMIWIDNPSEGNARVNKGVFNLHSISEIKEKHVKLRMIVGTKGNKLIVYIVNNTNTDFGARHFRFLSHIYSGFPRMSDEEMKKVFNTEKFEKRIERIPSGSIFKIFEFELSEYSKNKLEDNLEIGSYLFLIEHYENELIRRDGTEHMGNNIFNPIYLYFENNELNYGYSFQGGIEEQPESENSIPIVYIDVKSQRGNVKYSVNINSKINSKETTCLVQYIVPSHSCEIEYSIDLKIKNELIRDEKKKIEIKVPMYKLGEGLRIRNEEAFTLLEKNSIEKLFISEHNDFINQFKYNPEEWKNDQIVQTDEYDKTR